MIACCADVGLGFSTLPEELFDELLDEDEDDELVPELPDDSCFNLSPSPQNVSANVISPNVRIDFMYLPPDGLRSREHFHRNGAKKQSWSWAFGFWFWIV